MVFEILLRASTVSLSSSHIDIFDKYELILFKQLEMFQSRLCNIANYQQYLGPMSFSFYRTVWREVRSAFKAIPHNLLG